LPIPRSPPWLTFVALSLLFFLVNAGTFNSLGVVLPAMVGELRWNWTLAGAGFTILGVACGLSSFIPAMLIRRLGVRFVMICGTLLLMTGFAILASAHAGWTYLFATALLGVAFALTSTVPGAHVLTGLFERRSTVLGAYFTIGALGGFAGPLLYVAIHAVTGGWRLFWVVFVVASALAGGLAVATTPGRRPREPAPEIPPEQVDPVKMIQGLRDWTVRRALATPQFYVIVGAYSVYLLINTTTHGFAVEHLTERGVDPRAAAGMLSLEALVGAAIAIIGGVAGEKVPPKWLMIIALTATAVGMAALAEARDWGLMLVYALGMGTGFGLSFLASTMLLLNFFGKRINLELYSIMSVISTSAAAGPAFGGWARDATGSFTGMFLLCAGAVVAMLVAACFLTPPTIDAAHKGRGPRLQGGPAAAKDIGKTNPV
jgi:MFS family permease